ncbi:MAG: hypothetical protein IPF66_08115 [Holophagales bacterium]|nr:hypothetical protein [Holophagales bacterium]
MRRSLLVVAAVLALSADDRHAGKGSDGRQMIGTAVAIAETGGIGLAKGAPRAVDRGDHAVSRYGFGTTLAQLPAAFLAPLVERRFGAGSSQPLFLLAPFAAVLLAAAASGYAARLAGASASGTSLAVLLAGLGSPLAAYATSDYSEPLQAAALGGALALAFGAARETAPGASARLAAAAGFSAGFAVLLKSSLAAVAPILLLPLAAASFLRGRRLLAAALGSSVPLAAWLVLEIVRFGAPFSGYGGEGFTHPLLDGLWRLLVGPNRGLLLFFPAAALAGVALLRELRSGVDAPRRLAAAASLAAAAVLLVTAASWWAWHGAGGWGPRLLVPAVPLLAPWAALVAAGLADRPRRLVAGLSIALNLPPLLLHTSFVDTYVANARRPALTPRLEKQIPAIAIEPNDEGRPSVPPDQVLATVPAAAPHVVHPWYFAATLAGTPDKVAARLSRPPWYDRRPDLGPRLVPFPAELAAILAPLPRWGFFGRSLLHGASDPASGSVYLQSLAGQVLRAHETGRLDEGLVLADRLLALRPGEEGDALYVESLRLLGRFDTAAAFLGSLPRDREATPSILAVRALLARDRKDPERASRFAGAAAPWFPGTPLATAPSKPSVWPGTFAAFIRHEEARVEPGLPGVGTAR